MFLYFYGQNLMVPSFFNIYFYYFCLQKNLWNFALLLLNMEFVFAVRSLIFEVPELSLGKHSQITFIFEVLVFFLFISRIANIFLVMFCIAKTNIYNILIETIDVCVIWLFYVLVKLIFINFKINHILICDICAMILKHMAGCFLSNT